MTRRHGSGGIYLRYYLPNGGVLELHPLVFHLSRVFHGILRFHILGALFCLTALLFHVLGLTFLGFSLLLHGAHVDDKK